MPVLTQGAWRWSTYETDERRWARTARLFRVLLFVAKATAVLLVGWLAAVLWFA
jgi:hypothetical protein